MHEYYLFTYCAWILPPPLSPCHPFHHCHLTLCTPASTLPASQPPTLCLLPALNGCRGKKRWEVFIDSIELVFCMTKKMEFNSRLFPLRLNPATCNLFFWNYSARRRNELTLWTWEMEGEDKESEHNEREGDVGGGGWGVNQGVGSPRRQIPLHYWWKWMAEGFREAWFRAMSACRVTLIDEAFAVAQAPVYPRVPFQFAPWFIYRDTPLNNHWGDSGLACGLCAVVPCKSHSCFHCRIAGEGG